MSQFSTGELAKAAEVSVRTVQYYDQRGILTPSEVTEGGRRIYHESDLERLQVICFLRDLDFSINQIKKLLQEENREQVLELLLTDQIESLEKSSEEIEVKLKRARHLQKATARRHQLSLEDLSDISRLMENQKSWRHLQLRMYGSVVLISLLYLIDQRPYRAVSDPLDLLGQIGIPGRAVHDRISIFQRHLLHTGFYHSLPLCFLNRTKVLALHFNSFKE